jgi:cobalt-zinc-cadmium efflux system protein
MGHGHGHGAVGHAGGRYRSRLAVTFVLVAGFLVVELVAGVWSG